MQPIVRRMSCRYIRNICPSSHSDMPMTRPDVSITRRVINRQLLLRLRRPSIQTVHPHRLQLLLHLPQTCVRGTVSMSPLVSRLKNYYPLNLNNNHHHHQKPYRQPLLSTCRRKRSLQTSPRTPRPRHPPQPTCNTLNNIYRTRRHPRHRSTRIVEACSSPRTPRSDRRVYSRTMRRTTRAPRVFHRRLRSVRWPTLSRPTCRTHRAFSAACSRARTPI